MTLIVPDVGEEAFLDLFLAVNYTLRLFTNDITLDGDYPDQVTAGDFTEASFTGYSAAALTGGSWSTIQDDPSTGAYASQTFTRTSTGAAQIVRGYYVVTTTGGTLRWYETIDPVTLEFADDQLIVTPRMTLRDELDA